MRTTRICNAAAAYCCNPSLVVILLLCRLLTTEVLGKLPLDSARPALLLSKRIHHPHIFFIAPSGFVVVVVVEVVLLVVRATTGPVAVCSTFAVKLVV